MTPLHSAVVVADRSVESGALRAASDILQLLLRFRGFTTHVLRGAAVPELRSVARLVGANAVLFVGSPPEALRRAPAAGVAAACFRGERAVAGGVVAQLSSRPRLAADELSSLVRGVADSDVGTDRAAP